MHLSLINFIGESYWQIYWRLAKYRNKHTPRFGKLQDAIIPIDIKIEI